MMLLLMNTSDPDNPGVHKTVASNCVAGVERNVFVFIFGPTLSPPPHWLLGSDTNFAAAQSAVPCGPAQGWANLGSDPKNQRGASFGRVYEQKKYTRHGALRPTNQIFLSQRAYRAGTSSLQT